MATIDAGVSRLVTITGPGGSGKTRLAVAAAHKLAQLSSDSVYFVALSQLSRAIDVAGEIASPFGIVLSVDGDAETSLVRALRERRAVLLLDNFEHLLDASPLVARLLADAPRLRMIVTSQAPLRIRGERQLALHPLDLPARDDRDSVLAAGASRLLLDRTCDADPEFQLTDDNASSIARLCRAIGGLPLAIELAAARLTLLTPAELLERLKSGIEALGRGPADLPPRMRGLRAALDWTYGLLTLDEATLLRAMAIFAGAVPLERVERVCPDLDVLGALARLVDLSLVTRGTDARFVLHPGVRAYALERMTLAGEHEALALRHRAAYVEACTSWSARFLFDSNDVQVAVLREEADIGQVLTQLSGADDVAFAQVAGGFAMPLFFAARLQPWTDLIEHEYERAEAAGRVAAWLALAGALTALQRDDVASAQTRLERAVDAPDASDDVRVAWRLRCCQIIFGVLAGVVEGVRAPLTALQRSARARGDAEMMALADGLEPFVLTYCEGRHQEASTIWTAIVSDPASKDFVGWTAPYCWPDTELLAGHLERALQGYRAALRGGARAHSPTIAYQLDGIVIACSGLKRHADALEAAGWADTVRESAGPAMNRWFRSLALNARRRSRDALGPVLADAAYDRGRALSYDAAIAAALQADGMGAVPAAHVDAGVVEPAATER